MEVMSSVAKNKAFKQFEKEQDKDFWKYHIDASLPNHTFVRRDVQPKVNRQGTGVQTITFSLPKDGLVGKMLLKLEAVSGTVVFKANGGLNMCSEVRLANPFGIISRLYPEAVFQKIEEMQNDSQRSMMNTLCGDNTGISYMPLLFDMFDHVNGFLDTVHDTPYWLECDFVDSTSICSTHTNPVWRASVVAEYVVLPEQERKELLKQYPLAKSIKNFNKEKPVSASAGVNNIQLRQKGLCSRMYVAIKTSNALTYEGINSVKLVFNGRTVVNFDNLVENQFFSHNYMGVASDVFGSSSTAIWSVNFDISSKQNGYRGGVYLNSNNNEDWRLEVNASNAGDLIIVEEMYELVRIDKQGLMKVKSV